MTQFFVKLQCSRPCRVARDCPIHPLDTGSLETSSMNDTQMRLFAVVRGRGLLIQDKTVQSMSFTISHWEIPKYAAVFRTLQKSCTDGDYGLSSWCCQRQTDHWLYWHSGAPKFMTPIELQLTALDQAKLKQNSPSDDNADQNVTILSCPWHHSSPDHPVTSQHRLWNTIRQSNSVEVSYHKSMSFCLIIDPSISYKLTALVTWLLALNVYWDQCPFYFFMVLAYPSPVLYISCSTVVRETWGRKMTH